VIKSSKEVQNCYEISSFPDVLSFKVAPKLHPHECGYQPEVFEPELSKDPCLNSVKEFSQVANPHSIVDMYNDETVYESLLPQAMEHEQCVISLWHDQAETH
jgi:hypothetical protein